MNQPTRDTEPDPAARRLYEQFETVDPKADFPKEETRILEFWNDRKIFERSVNGRKGEKPFVFFEGPPTANGKPGIHHIEARAFKDAMPRFQTMRGRYVERKAGWDTHGLPVELQVEKSLGISGKPQIESIVPGDVHASIAAFNAKCKESVWQYRKEWEQLTERMGFWINLTDPYVTYENSYIESVWWVLKQLWDKQLLYEDFKVVPYCPRCGTALSSHEVAQGYEETTDRSVYVKFPVVGQPNTYLVAWTTTPWTLPGNVALAMNRSIQYGRYKIDDSEYLLADSRAEAVLQGEGARIADVSIEELESLAYEPLFVISTLAGEKSYKVYPADFVTADDGTGFVHTAVMYGEDDFQLGTSVGLPKQHTVDREGKFTADVADFAGQFVKAESTEQGIIDYLKDSSLLFREEPYRHTYPFCWRCKTPLLYYAKQSWFIRMSSLRTQLLERNETIKWVPENIRDGRFGEWLRDVKDWALSRDRYWGTPLPIWRCVQCGNAECIGSVTELTERSGKTLDDLHKPFIDDVTFDCQACGQKMERYPEVIDVWFDSGAMPYAQWHYPFDAMSKERVDRGMSFPADYIAEAVDQTRGWFYTLVAIATALDLPAPFRSAVSLGHVLDKSGKKMSKSRGNIVDPWEVMNAVGVDAARLYFYSVNQPGEPKKFDVSDVEQVVRKTFLILWNSYSFLAQRVAGNQSITIPVNVPESTEFLDQWLVARMLEVRTTVTEATERLDFFTASRALIDAVTELSTWYVKLSRKRDDSEFLPTLAWALKELSILFAPFTPFVADMFWQRLRGSADSESVHLVDWPTEREPDQSVLKEMKTIQTVLELGRAARATAGIKVRQPLTSATVGGTNLSPAGQSIIEKELNVHEVLVRATDTEFSVVLDTELTDSLRAEGLARDITRTIQGLRKAIGMQPGQKAEVRITGNHRLLELVSLHFSGIQAATDTSIEVHETPYQASEEVESLVISLQPLA